MPVLTRSQTRNQNNVVINQEQPKQELPKQELPRQEQIKSLQYELNNAEGIERALILSKLLYLSKF